MGQISIMTPLGVKTGVIKGDVPTEEELIKIREMFPSPDGSSFDYRVLKGRTFGPDNPVVSSDRVESPSVKAEEPKPVVLPMGEVEDSWLRFQLGRMDNDEEKQNLLNNLLGEGTSEKVSPGTFVIDQSKVDPQIRERYGLADTGRISLDKPGFTWNDLIDFGGEAGPETLAAVGASIAATGVGIIPGMLIVGAAAGVAKAADEAIEWAQGLNRQSAGQVSAMIATSGISNALFEGAGRKVAQGIGWVIKGRGPDISVKRIDELTDEYLKLGHKPKAAARLGKRAAREEALANMSSAVRAGARPTVEAAAGKGLAARALAIYEKLFKNPKIGEANTRYIGDVLKQVDEGVLSEAEAVKLLTANDSSIASLIAGNLANPEEAFKLTKQHYDNFVAKELARYEAKFVPSAKMPDDYTKNLQLAATLFRTESTNLYDLAGQTIGKSGLFDISPVLKTLDDLGKQNPFVEYSGSLFNTIRQRAVQGKLSIGELQNLKSALRISRGDTELVSSAAQGGITKLIGSIDNLMLSKQSELAEQVARGYRIEVVPAGQGAQLLDTGLGLVFSPRGAGVTYRKVPINPSELSRLREGLDQWDKANAFFKSGQDQFNNTALNTVLQNAKGGYFTSNIDILKIAVEAGNAPKLAMYLNAVTPSSNMIQKLSQPGTAEIIENVRRLVDGDQFKAAEDLIKSSGLEKVIPKIQGFIDDLPAADVFRVSQKKSYLAQLDDLAQLSISGASPQIMRQSVRNSLAKTWISQAREAAQDQFKQFNPQQFSDQFIKLGDDLQDALFGKAEASLMREAMETFKASSISKGSAEELFAALPTLTNQPLKASIQSLKEIFERGARESEDAVLSAISNGTIRNPLELVAGVLKSPNSYQRLKNVVGEEKLVEPGGLKDMVMNNLLQNGFKESLETGTIQSGAWGKSFKSAIQSQNQNGALNTILGKDTVDQLIKIADNAVKISDAPIAGFGALQQATLPLTLLALVATGQIGTAVGTASTMMVVSRALRNPGLLKLLTSPKVRSNEYSKALAAGADLPSLAKLKADGPFVYNLNRAANIIASETAILAGSGIIGDVLEESASGVREGYRQAQEQIRSGSQPGAVTREGVAPPQPTIKFEDVLRRGAASGNVKGASEILRRIEQDKLMGIGANQ